MPEATYSGGEVLTSTSMVLLMKDNQKQEEDALNKKKNHGSIFLRTLDDSSYSTSTDSSIRRSASGSSRMLNHRPGLHENSEDGGSEGVNGKQQPPTPPSSSSSALQGIINTGHDISNFNNMGETTVTASILKEYQQEGYGDIESGNATKANHKETMMPTPPVRQHNSSSNFCVPVKKELPLSALTLDPQSSSQPGATAVPGDMMCASSTASVYQYAASNLDVNGATPLIAAEVVSPDRDSSSQLISDEDEITRRVLEQMRQTTVQAEIVVPYQGDSSVGGHRDDTTTNCVNKRMYKAGSSSQDVNESFWHRNTKVIICSAVALLVVVVAVTVGVLVGSAGGSDTRAATTADSNLQESQSVAPVCPLCYGGSEPGDLAFTLNDEGLTCATFEMQLAALDTSASSNRTCVAGQALGWLCCLCDMLPPPLPAASILCSQKHTKCSDDTKPAAYGTKVCRNFRNYIELAGVSDETCDQALAELPEECRCTSGSNTTAGDGAAGAGN